MNRNTEQHRYHEENIFSLSIGDLMTSLLLIFVLIITVMLLKLNEHQERLKVVLLKLNEQQEKNQERLDMISEQEVAKRSIIAQLKGEMEQFDLEVDPRTGVIRIKESVLFDSGKSALKYSGRRYLDKFIPKYAEILLSKPEIRNQIGQIIIEGHTDNIGSYNYNLKLSLSRANAVAAYIFSREIINNSNGLEHEQIFLEKLSVNGRSFISPIDSNEIEAGRQRNRRVEFKFSFKDWTTLEIEGSSLEKINE